jgi:hypothetical protein
MHRRLAALACSGLALLAVAVPSVPAHAAGADAGTEIYPGWFILDGTVKCPDSPARAMNSKQAMAFIQSWYLATLYGALKEGQPPASAKVCTFFAHDTINGENFEFHSFYASQGDKVWVGLPKQVIGPGAVVPVKKWFVAPPRATPGFLGTLEPAPIAGTTTTTQPVTPVKAESSGSSRGWIIVVIPVVALLGVGAFVVRNRRRAASGTPKPGPAA